MHVFLHQLVTSEVRINMTVNLGCWRSWTVPICVVLRQESWQLTTIWPDYLNQLAFFVSVRPTQRRSKYPHCFRSGQFFFWKLDKMWILEVLSKIVLELRMRKLILKDAVYSSILQALRNLTSKLIMAYYFYFKEVYVLSLHFLTFHYLKGLKS